MADHGRAKNGQRCSFLQVESAAFVLILVDRAVAELYLGSTLDDRRGKMNDLILIYPFFLY